MATVSDIMFLNDRVTAARTRWRRLLATGTAEQEREAFEELRRLENKLRTAVAARGREGMAA